MRRAAQVVGVVALVAIAVLAARYAGHEAYRYWATTPPHPDFTELIRAVAVGAPFSVLLFPVTYLVAAAAFNSATGAGVGQIMGHWFFAVTLINWGLLAILLVGVTRLGWLHKRRRAPADAEASGPCQVQPQDLPQ